MNTVRDDPEFRALLAYSARIGRDPALVQGAGGNTSLKRDGVLWVKASGTWLMQAEARAIMVPVRIAPMRAALDRPDDTAERAEAFVVAEESPAGLRPSIETSMHAALPHPVVVHVHCVETIAWAARADAPTALAPLLDGLRWGFVPYVRPGAPLTRAILRTAPDADVLVMGNHGLTVGGRNVAEAAALVAEVARRLRRPVREAGPPDRTALARLATGSPYRAAEDPSTHRLGTDPGSLAVAQRGSFYPDHVIFLGPGVATLRPGETAAEAAARITAAGAPPPPMLVAPGAGVLLHGGAPAGAVALARCLADVTARLSPDEPLAPLHPQQEAELAGWDAEAYRQAQDPGA